MNRFPVAMPFTVALVALLSLFQPAHSARADQLDEVAAKPDGAMVVVDPTGKTVNVYKVDRLDPALRSKAVESLSDNEKDRLVNDEATRIARPENLVARLQGASSELDREGSHSAWWTGFWGPGWGWTGWGGYGVPYSFFWGNPWSFPGTLYYGVSPFAYGFVYVPVVAWDYYPGATSTPREETAPAPKPDHGGTTPAPTPAPKPETGGQRPAAATDPSRPSYGWYW
jgi:hypothetical protein